jgi:formylglycine-generating enzyme required for sulfatase activity
VHPVKELKVNGFGLYDMSGNVYEWCEDDYTDHLIGGVDPWIQGRGLQKVGKGGSYRSKEKSVQVENRTSADPTVSTPFIGFRLVRTIGVGH